MSAKGIVSITHNASIGWWAQAVANTRDDQFTGCRVMGCVRHTEDEAKADIPKAKSAAEAMVGASVEWARVKTEADK